MLFSKYNVLPLKTNFMQNIAYSINLSVIMKVNSWNCRLSIIQAFARRESSPKASFLLSCFFNALFSSLSCITEERISKWIRAGLNFNVWIFIGLKSYRGRYHYQQKSICQILTLCICRYKGNVCVVRVESQLKWMRFRTFA